MYSQDVIRASILFLVDGGSGITNSGGSITDLSNLAEQVVQINNSNSEIYFNEPDNQASLDYLSPISEIPKKYWVQEFDLKQQIFETSAGIDC